MLQAINLYGLQYCSCLKAELSYPHAGAADEGNGPIITPLMQFLAEKHALKAPAAKAAGKAGPGRGASGQRKGAARLRTTSLAPVAEAEESAPVAAAAPAAAPNAHAGRRKVCSGQRAVCCHLRPLCCTEWPHCVANQAFVFHRRLASRTRSLLPKRQPCALSAKPLMMPSSGLRRSLPR